MKLSNKVILSLILVLTLAFSLIACNDKESTEPCETHTDKDGNGVCDVCKSAVKVPAACTHKDLNDDETPRAKATGVGGAGDHQTTECRGDHTQQQQNQITFEKRFFKAGKIAAHGVTSLRKLTHLF
jgi:hypothetical protein